MNGGSTTTLTETARHQQLLLTDAACQLLPPSSNFAMPPPISGLLEEQVRLTCGSPNGLQKRTRHISNETHPTDISNGDLSARGRGLAAQRTGRTHGSSPREELTTGALWECGSQSTPNPRRRGSRRLLP
jgi:hypothetical protein